MATDQEVLLIKLEADIKDAEAKLNKAKKAFDAAGGSVDKLNKQVGGANTALVNFGRVVQDAPFGLIGIANNIDPLITSFQALRQQTGSTGGALRSLVSSLTGPAGIAIAVSAATSLLIAFGPQIKEFFGTVDLAAERAAKAAEAFKSASESVASEAANVEVLIAVLRDENTTRAQKQKAIEELNRVAPVYFSGLKLEEGLVKGLDPAYKSYVNSLLQTAKAKAAQSAITDLYTKRLELENKLIGTDLESASRKAAKANEQLNKARQNGTQLGIGPVLTKDEQAALALQNQITELDRQIQQYAASAAPAFTKATVDKEKAVKAETKTIKDYRNELQGLSLQEFRNQTEQLNLIRTIASERKKAQQQDLTGKAKALTEPLTAPLDLAQRLKIPQAVLDQLKAFDELSKKANESVQNIVVGFNLLTPVIDQAFNALANGTSGVDALTQAVKRLIIDLAKAAALALVLSLVPGGGGIGAFFGKFTQLLGFRANGGPVGGGPVVVGERGPELFVPNTSGAIVSNQNLLGGGLGELVARISGNDLLILLNRAQRQQGRLG